MGLGRLIKRLTCLFGAGSLASVLAGYHPTLATFVGFSLETYRPLLAGFLVVVFYPILARLIGLKEKGKKLYKGV